MDERSLQLQELVDDDDLDALLRVVTLDDIAIAWCHYQREDHPKRTDNDPDEDPDWWAVDLFYNRAIYKRRGLYRELLLRLVHHADAHVLGAIGAGPLENFVSDDESDLSWIEQECRTNTGLRTALSGVWCWSFVSEANMMRLDLAARVPMSRPRPREEWPADLIAVDDAERELVETVGRDWQDIRKPTREQQVAIDRYKKALKLWLDRTLARQQQMRKAR